MKNKCDKNLNICVLGRNFTPTPILCPHVESNHNLSLRRAMLYPLSYGDIGVGARLQPSYLLKDYLILPKTQ